MREPDLDRINNTMIKYLIDAVYPILIPIEEQSIQVQQRNYERIRKVVEELWRNWREQPTGSNTDAASG